MGNDVLILMGSDSDLDLMKGCSDLLDEFGVSYRMTVSSAHRTPQRTHDLIKDAEREGVKLIIAGAGAAAHLAGVVASHTTRPVIGVPVDSSPLEGVDALYSTVQMPPGIPVAAMAVGKAGARNAAVFAVEILALNNEDLASALVKFRGKMAADVESKARRIEGG